MSFAPLTHQEIEDLKQTVGTIAAHNQVTFSLSKHFQQCENQSLSALQLLELRSEFSKNTLIVDKLAAITLSILDDASKMLETNQALQERSEELLQGIRAIELDYYELREQNEQLLRAEEQSYRQHMALRKQIDSISIKNKDLSQQLYESNQKYEQELIFWKKEMALKNFNPETAFFRKQISKHQMYDMEIEDLKQELIELKKICFQQKKELLESKRKLETAQFALSTLQEENKALNSKQEHLGTLQQINRSKSWQAEEQTSIVASSSLKLLLQNIPEICRTGEEQRPVLTIQNDSSTSRDMSRETVLGTESHFQIQGIYSANEGQNQKNVLQKYQEIPIQMVSQSSKKESACNYQKTLKKNQQKIGHKKTMETDKQTSQHLYDSQELALKLKLNELTKPKPSKLQKIKSLSNMLGNTQDTSHNAKLIKKYRGDFESKHPNLRKFTNKILEKKAEVIAEGMNRCGSHHLLLRKIVPK